MSMRCSRFWRRDTTQRDRTGRDSPPTSIKTITKRQNMRKIHSTTEQKEKCKETKAKAERTQGALPFRDQSILGEEYVFSEGQAHP